MHDPPQVQTEGRPEQEEVKTLGESKTEVNRKTKPDMPAEHLKDAVVKSTSDIHLVVRLMWVSMVCAVL